MTTRGSLIGNPSSIQQISPLRTIMPNLIITDECSKWRFSGWKTSYKNQIQNVLQYLRSNTLSSRFFRLGWCGNDKPSPRRTFHSIRRSGGIYSNLVYCFLKALMVSAKSLGLFLFCWRKRKTKPSRPINLYQNLHEISTMTEQISPLIII